jgi:tetratricopeptide (TPR) repeat protein
MSHPPDLADDWLRLRRHLERSSGFTPCFLFVGASYATRDLQHLLRGFLRWRTSELVVVDAIEDADPVPAVLAAVCTPDDVRARMKSPVWVTLNRRPGDPEADGVRRAVLAALNERRGALEHVFRRPLILALPVGANQDVWTYAPDLWTVRGVVAEPGRAASGVDRELPTPASLPEPAPETATGTGALDEWERVRAVAEATPERVSPWVAVTATAQALALGQIAEAARIANEGLSLARARAGSRTADAQRDLSVSLDNVGRVAEAQGEWAAAETPYRESLTLARALADRLGTPEAQRDLSVALNNVGRVAVAQGKWAAAETPYRESLTLARALADRLGTPQAQRDLSVSLDHVGRVAEAQGEWAAAETAYRESLTLARALATLIPTPQASQDLAAAERALAGLAQRRGTARVGE